MERRPLVIINGSLQELPLNDTLPGDPEVPYSKRIDFITQNEIYRGEAQVGSSENSPLWRIRKIVISGDGDVTETWADGSSDFNKLWTSRLSYTYT